MQRIIVVEDHPAIVETCRDNGLECYENAADALKTLRNSDHVSLVYLDVHGIEKDGVTAHDIALFCRERGITVIVTSSDPGEQVIFATDYGCKFGSKTDAMLARMPA